MDNKKPLILSYKECCDNISKVINESQLPAFMLETILRNTLFQIQNAVINEYNAACSCYNKSQSNSGNANE